MQRLGLPHFERKKLQPRDMLKSDRSRANKSWYKNAKCSPVTLDDPSQNMESRGTLLLAYKLRGRKNQIAMQTFYTRDFPVY
jgi:hypothetical protein